MKIILTFCFSLFFVTTSISQNTDPLQHNWIKLDTTYLVIDNSPRCWSTFELKTDTIYQLEKNIYFFNNKTVQFINAPFDKNGSNFITTKSEELILKAHKKWELDYQKKTLKSRLKDGELLYLNKKGKLFLIWWYETPTNGKVPGKSMSIPVSPKFKINPDGIVINSTHQLYLDCVTNRNICYTISMPVLEIETLESEITKLKIIANSFNVYGGPIDVNFLEKRLNFKNNYIFRDSLNFIQIEVPQWLNIVKNPYKNCLFGTFPEKDNIINATAILWEYKTPNSTFKDFVNKFRTQHDNQVILIDKDNYRREYFTKENSTFYCQNIYLSGDSINCFVTFTATPTTYTYNLTKLNELLEKVKIK